MAVDQRVAYTRTNHAISRRLCTSRPPTSPIPLNSQASCVRPSDPVIFHPQSNITHLQLPCLLISHSRCSSGRQTRLPGDTKRRGLRGRVGRCTYDCNQQIDMEGRGPTKYRRDGDRDCRLIRPMPHGRTRRDRTIHATVSRRCGIGLSPLVEAEGSG